MNRRTVLILAQSPSIRNCTYCMNPRPLLNCLFILNVCTHTGLERHPAEVENLLGTLK